MIRAPGYKSLNSVKKNKRFIDHYAKGDNWHNIDKDKGNLGYGWIHYALIRNSRPGRVLVIGSKYGYIPAVCAAACKDNGKGLVDFVDANYDVSKKEDSEKHWGGVGFWDKVNIKKHFGKYGLERYISAHITTTKEFARKYPKRSWGYINIDGDHSYGGVKYDFDTFWPRLKKGGFISLHDIYTKKIDELEYGTHRYWKEVRKRYSNTIEFPGDYGLGLLQKSKV